MDNDLKGFFIPEAPEPVKKKWQFWRKDDLSGRMTWYEWRDRVKNADFQIKPITEQNQLILTFAKRRTGKTYDDTADGLASMAKGEYNAFNYDLNIPPWIDPKYYIRFHDISEVCFVPRIRIHIDEATQDFDCHDWAGVAQSVRRWISEIGKYQQCVRVIVQVAKQIDPSFRDQCDTIYLINRFWRILHKRKYIRHIDNPNVAPPWDYEGGLANIFHMFKRFRLLQKSIFAAFNTYQHFMIKKGISRKEQQKNMIDSFNKMIETTAVFSSTEVHKLLS